MKGTDAKPFRILSLDGGGIRGILIAGFLADLEQRLGCMMADHFDLIAGTSTGGIIAAALALGESAEKIEKFYRERGPKIFQRRKPLPLSRWQRIKKHFAKSRLEEYGLDYDQLHQSKYDGKELRAALDDVFADRTIEDAFTRLVIPAVDLIRGQTIVFKTPHLPDMIRDRRYRAVDVLMATTAAPTFFPHATIADGSAFVDGGLWANNPSMVAIAEALRIRDKAARDGEDLPIEIESIHLLSVGTGKATYFAKPPADGAGMMWWGAKLFNVASAAQSQGVNFQAKYILGDRMHRVDFDLPDGRCTLDNVELLSEMARIGHGKCEEMLASLKGVFFSSRAGHPYRDFPDLNPAA